jgi:hypothetical protein
VASLGTSLMMKVLADLQELLQVSTSIFMCLPIELTNLYHVDQSRLELKSFVSNSTAGLVWMLVVVGAEKSWSVFLAITSNSGVKLRLIVESSNVEGDGLF